MIEEEQIGDKNKKYTRKSMAKAAVENVFTVLRANYNMDIKEFDIHLNFPGGIPVDGPSAGISIAVAIAICFIITPLFNSLFDGKAEIIRVKSKITQGEAITEEKIEKVTVGKLNLPENIATSEDQIIGLYATSTIYAGDFITPEKVSNTIDTTDTLLLSLKEGEMAMSIAIQSLASGVSNTIKRGDIIQVYVKDKDDKMTAPQELQFVEVLSATNDDGIEINSNIDEENSMTKTIIIKVQNSKQAQAIALAEQNTMHIAFVTRDESEKEKLLEEQLSLLNRINVDDETTSDIDINTEE